MLTKSTMNRLCNFSSIKAEPWFSSFAWEELISLNLTPPTLPQLAQIDENKISQIPYLNYIKNLKDSFNKENNSDKKKQIEYDKWFQKF